MPQHASAKKRVRQDAKRRLRNRYHRSRVRTLIKRLRSTTQASEEVSGLLNSVKAYLDRLATKGIIHPNKAANLKSQLEKHANRLVAAA
jgi:small subunit ribosomal protein S20